MASTALSCSPDEYRKGMRRLMGAVTLVCTSENGRRFGMTATAVSSVCAEPPTLLVCLNRTGSTAAAITKSQILCVNVLAPGPEAVELARLFSRPSADSDRFNLGLWGDLATGAPVLSTSLASFDCEVVEMSDIGSHRVFFARMRAVRTAEERSALGYFDGDFVVPAPLQETRAACGT